jgi:phytoene desaturase
MAKSAIVIGSGFSGLSVSASLAQQGYKVTVLEKHPTPGGRARQMVADGYTFDMGPSWYWMPDVFEKYFESFGKKVEDFITSIDWIHLILSIGVKMILQQFLRAKKL